MLSDAPYSLLLKQYRANKREERKQQNKISSLKGNVPVDGRWEAKIGNVVKCIALGDIGADFSALPKSIIEQLESNGVTINLRPLDKKLSISAAIELPLSAPITTSATITNSITISLPCGPLRLKNVEFHVIDQNMDEVLLDRPLLRCLGFDLKAHVSKFKGRFDNADVGEPMAKKLNSDGVKNGKAGSLPTYRGLWYNKLEDDPIEPPQSVGAKIGEDEESEIQAAFEEMVMQAGSNGMTPKGQEDAKELLQQFRDIFRIKLGANPPARVPPMQIRPYRSTQIRYAPPQRAFISSTIRRLQEVKAVYANPKARWASPALAVAKPGREIIDSLSTSEGPTARQFQFPLQCPLSRG